MGDARISPGEPKPKPDPMPTPSACPVCKRKLTVVTRRVRSHRGGEQQRRFWICTPCKVRIVLHRFPPKATYNDTREWPPPWKKVR